MFTVENGVLTEYHGNGGIVQIPEGVIEIADGVFAEHLDLTPNIGANHFKLRNSFDSELVEVILPESLRKIGCSAFYGCQKLTKVNIPVNVETIGVEAFAACPSLREVYFDAKKCEPTYTKYYSSSRPINAFAACGQTKEGIKITVGKDVEQFPDSIFVMLNFSHSIRYTIPVHVYLFYEGCPRITEICFEDGLNKNIIKEICASFENYFFSYFLQTVQISADNRLEIRNIVKELISVTESENRTPNSSDSLPIPLLKGSWSGEKIDLQISRVIRRSDQISDLLKKIKSVVFGAAVADAVGVPVEFLSRQKLKENPVVDMIGYGTYHLPEGCWSDDTSMSLAALDSLKDGEVDFISIMKNFVDWLHSCKYTATGWVFDCGRTCLRAIEKYRSSDGSLYECGSTSEDSNGNGSLMRIYPFVLFAVNNGFDSSEMIELIHTASALTHGHQRSKMACGIYAFVLSELLKSPTKKALKLGLKKAKEYYQNFTEFSRFEPLFSTGIFTSSIQRRSRKSIKSSGYVVDTLEAAIWSVLTTNSYQKCILKAVNLGEDTDTVAAVAGAIAGALYGYRSIPENWLSKLKKKEEIEDICFEVAYNWSDKKIKGKLRI